MAIPKGPSTAPGTPSEPINLRVARRRAGLSLRVTAERMGISRETLNRAELGVTPWPSSQLAIARFYGLDVIVQWPEPEPEREAA